MLGCALLIATQSWTPTTVAPRFVNQHAGRLVLPRAAAVPRMAFAMPSFGGKQSEEPADGFADKRSDADRTEVEQKRVDCLERW